MGYYKHLLSVCAGLVLGACGTAPPPDPIQTTAPPQQALPSDPESQYQQALALFNRQQDKKAIALLTEAGRQGHAESQYMLGIVHNIGREVPKDNAKALWWFAKAALQGHTKSQYQVGDAFIQGRGVAEEPAWGMLWVAKAAAGGHDGAQYSLGHGYTRGLGLPVDLVQAWKWLTLADKSGNPLAANLKPQVEAAMSVEEKTLALWYVERWRPEPKAEEPAQRFIQFALARLGWRGIPQNGRGDGATAEAIALYAQRNGLPATDKPTPALLEHLRNAIKTEPSPFLGG